MTDAQAPLFRIILDPPTTSYAVIHETKDHNEAHYMMLETLRKVHDEGSGDFVRLYPRDNGNGILYQILRVPG